MNLQHIKNIIREQLNQLRRSKQTLNEELPQWVKNCCRQKWTGYTRCCELVADNPGKQIPKDVLNKLKKQLSEQMGNSGCTPETESITCDCNSANGMPASTCTGTYYVHDDCTSQQDCSCCPGSPPFTIGKRGFKAPTVYTPAPGSRPSSGQTLNEGIPQWLRDCCDRGYKPCCKIVREKGGKYTQTSPGSRPSGQTLNEGTKCPPSIQVNCSGGTPCNASWQDGNGGSDGCVYEDCCDEGPQSIIPTGPNAPMAYQNKRR